MSSISPAFADDEATDTTPPVIQHLAIPQVQAVGSVRVDFTVSDQSALFGVLFHWRNEGEPTYRQIEFPDLTAKQFSARFTVQKDFEFWIEAYDENGNGPALDGSAEKPIVVKIAKATTATPPAKTEPPKTTAPATTTTATPSKTTTVEPPKTGTPTPAVEEEEEEEESISVAVDNSPPPPPPEPFFRPITQEQFFADHTGSVIHARNLPPGRIQLGLDAALFTGSNFLYPATSMLGESGTLKVSASLHEFVNIGFTSRFSHTSLSTTVTNPETGYPVSASVLNDFTLVGRFALRPIGPVRLGLLGGLEFPGRVKGTTGSFVLSPSVTALVTFEQSRFRAHLNAGYKWDNSGEGSYSKNAAGAVVGGRDSAFSTFALGLSSYDSINVGLAVDVMIKKAMPYASYDLSVPVDRAQMASCTSVTGASCPPAASLFPAASWQLPQRVTVGVRYEISPVLAIDGAAEFSLTKAGGGLDTDYNSTTKTASYLPLPGQVLPPPFLFRLGVLYQLGDVRLPWVKAPPATPAKVEPTAPALKPTAPPAVAPEKKPTPGLNQLEFEAPVKAPGKSGPSSHNSNDLPPKLVAELEQR